MTMGSAGKVATILRERGWCKGGSDGSAVCLMLAAEAAGVNHDQDLIRQLNKTISQRWAGRKTRNFIPAFQCQDDWWHIAEFNDHPDTTETDIYELLR